MSDDSTESINNMVRGDIAYMETTAREEGRKLTAVEQYILRQNRRVLQVDTEEDLLRHRRLEADEYLALSPEDQAQIPLPRLLREQGEASA